MAEGKIESESTERTSGTEGTVEITDLTTGLTDPMRPGRKQHAYRIGEITPTPYGTAFIESGAVFIERTPQYTGGGSIVDATGNPVSIVNVGDVGKAAVPQADFVFITLKKEEFEQLNTKTTEVLNQTALAYERIAKDHEEIEQLKTGTRAMLARLHAA